MPIKCLTQRQRGLADLPHMFSLQTLTCILPFVGIALGHGLITTPKPRAPGTATQAACGTGAYNTLKNDLTTPVEYALQAADSGYKADACKLYFCKGYQFEDNKSNVARFSTGQVVPFQINLRVRHTGYANVSVVDLATQTTIGQPLVNWPVYASPTVVANETTFNVTVPDLGTKCITAGACAIQWWWFGSSVKQTYESCVDFVTVPPPTV
ncbi:hypothetical protein CPB83DRAFT_845927 [Crepidotus variabilis]|uniref:Chitin-binding type-4 domain-containing protein n=1 Tax=Crepidotus variabilis TaxID=179855 RepID=A0A9P6ENS5_9AGAR|nr:hypothetical protein CPB83DRAFT_845927 [Crepidotus variabilis]